MGQSRTPYLFDTPTGKQTLADLFDGRSQLIVYHFMFEPDPRWKEGCPNCSLFLVDHIDGANLHLPHPAKGKMSGAARGALSIKMKALWANRKVAQQK